jgi:hypothetical protein
MPDARTDESSDDQVVSVGRGLVSYGTKTASTTHPFRRQWPQPTQVASSASITANTLCARCTESECTCCILLAGPPVRDMPKARQRIVVCDCLDCAERPDFDTGLLLSAANEAAAKQDPPPKSLIVCVSGAAATSPSREEGSSLDAVTCPHMKRVARDGGLGLLAFRSDKSGAALVLSIDSQHPHS